MSEHGMAITKKIDIHDYGKQLERSLARIKSDKRISKRNKQLILDFHSRLLADNLSTPRLVYYTNKLALIAAWIGKDFDKATRADIEAIARKINQMN